MDTVQEIVRTDLRDNKSLGDEYVSIIIEVFSRIKTDHPPVVGHNDYPHSIFYMGRKIRNIKDSHGEEINVVEFYISKGKMPYDIAYAKEGLLSNVILKRLEIILLNTREEATNIIENEYREDLKLPPRTI